MGVMYLKAKQIFTELEIWPNMIPVQDSSGKYKFTKRGKSKCEELRNLLFFATKKVKFQQWSEEMMDAVETYELNGDIKALGNKI